MPEKNINIMAQILAEKAKEIEAEGSPELNSGNAEVMGDKRMSLDEPMTEVKKDPLR